MDVIDIKEELKKFNKNFVYFYIGPEKPKYIEIENKKGVKIWEKQKSLILEEM